MDSKSIIFILDAGGTGFKFSAVQDYKEIVEPFTIKTASETLEEQLICFADKFFSKTKYLHAPRTLEQVVESMAKISENSAEKVKIWASMFM